MDLSTPVIEENEKGTMRLEVWSFGLSPSPNRLAVWARRKCYMTLNEENGQRSVYADAITP